MDLIRLSKNQVKPFKTWNLWKKKIWFQAFSIILPKVMDWLFMEFKILWNIWNQELLGKLFVMKDYNILESESETLKQIKFLPFTQNQKMLQIPPCTWMAKLNLKEFKMTKMKILFVSGFPCITKILDVNSNSWQINLLKELNSWRDSLDLVAFWDTRLILKFKRLSMWKMRMMISFDMYE